MSEEYMSDELFDELLVSVQEGGEILRGERAASRIFYYASGVMTLEETADYLRLPQAIIERQAQSGLIPGRLIENNWRFLREALDDWLYVRATN